MAGRPTPNNLLTRYFIYLFILFIVASIICCVCCMIQQSGMKVRLPPEPVEEYCRWCKQHKRVFRLNSSASTTQWQNQPFGSDAPHGVVLSYSSETLPSLRRSGHEYSTVVCCFCQQAHYLVYDMYAKLNASARRANERAIPARLRNPSVKPLALGSVCFAGGRSGAEKRCALTRMYVS